jgi:hypothetical protein
MATKKFALARASTSDLPELCRLQYKCFPQLIREIFMGCKTEDDLPRLAQHYEKSMRENPNDIWIKVTDPATGRIVSASNWRVYVNGTIPESDDAEIPEWLDAEDFERSRKVIQPLSEIRRKQNQGGFVRTFMPLHSRLHRESVRLVHVNTGLSRPTYLLYRP